MGKKALAQSAIFRQIRERLLPLSAAASAVDGRALACAVPYCWCGERRRRARRARFWRRPLLSVASCHWSVLADLWGYQCVQRLLNLMVKAAADVERFINAVEALVQI